MGLLNLIFGGGFNNFLIYFVVSLIIMILLIILNSLIDIIVPNILVGLSVLNTIISFLLLVFRNTLATTIKTPLGLAIIASLSLIILAIIFSSFTTSKNIIIKGAKTISPSSIGQVTKKTFRFKRRSSRCCNYRIILFISY